MSSNHLHHHPHQIIIFIAPGFDGLAVTFCFREFRKHGLAVSLVGAKSDGCHSHDSLIIQPDLTLEEMSAFTFSDDSGPRLAIIPSGRECAGLLLSDPRVLRVCSSVLQAGGYVAAFSPAQQLVVRSDLPIYQESSHFLAQNDASLSIFVQQLADCVSVVPQARHLNV